MAEADVIAHRRAAPLGRVAGRRSSASPRSWDCGRRGSSSAASGLLYAGVVPSSFKIVAALAHEIVSAGFYWNLEFTLMEVLVSLAIGCGAGLAVGLVVGANPFRRRGLRALPAIHGADAEDRVPAGACWCCSASAPARRSAHGRAVVLLPDGAVVAAGVRLVDPVLLRVGRSFNLTPAQMVRMIYLPALVPPIATGLRIGLGVAIIGCLLAELKMSNRGLGFMIMQYYAQFRTPQMYAILIVMFVLAVLANTLVARVFRLRGQR